MIPMATLSKVAEKITKNEIALWLFFFTIAVVLLPCSFGIVAGAGLALVAVLSMRKAVNGYRIKPSVVRFFGGQGEQD